MPIAVLNCCSIRPAVAMNCSDSKLFRGLPGAAEKVYGSLGRDAEGSTRSIRAFTAFAMISRLWMRIQWTCSGSMSNIGGR